VTAPPDAAVEVTTGCVLFTDLVGFTEYNDLVGDQAAVEVLDRQVALAHGVIESRDGARVVKELGDGLMLWFPTAIDGLTGAANFARAADDARRSGFPLAMRMGLHYGECVPRGDDLVGQTVNVAARVSALAGPGELLVSEPVLEACGPTIDTSLVLQPVGPVNVKGVTDPIWLQRLG
jgi:adenylate cyclase